MLLCRTATSDDRAAVAALYRDAGYTGGVAEADHVLVAEEAGRIFDRFHRGRAALRDAVRGSGLGLTLVRHAAEGHGGGAGYEPRSGGGAVFWFTVSTEGGA